MKFLTFRRYWLDQLLSETHFYGKVLDIGGKKENKRGQFRPPLEKVTSWEYLNIDETTSPDYLCSCDAIPVDDETFDVVLIADVLEHLEKPEVTLAEALRILKKGGRLVATIPFLYPIHPDPYDFQRWTPTKIELEFRKAGFDVTQLKFMGGFLAVAYDLFHVFLGTGSSNRQTLKIRVINSLVMPVLAKVFMWLDKHFIHKSKTITTGFYIIAIK